MINNVNIREKMARLAEERSLNFDLNTCGNAFERAIESK